MKRLIMLIAATAVAVFVSGCASDKEFLKAQADAITAQANAKVAEEQRRQEEARAVIAVSGKLDAGGAAAYVLGLAFKGVAGASPAPQLAVQRPRDFLDYMNGFTQLFGTVANAAVPIVTVLQQGKSTRAGYQRDMEVERTRQTGESSRIQSVADIASTVAAHQPAPNVTTTTNNFGRDGVLGGNQANNNSTTTTTTHTCNGGAAGNGATGTPTVPGSPGGSAPGGTC